MSTQSKEWLEKIFSVPVFLGTEFQLFLKSQENAMNSFKDQI